MKFLAKMGVKLYEGKHKVRFHRNEAPNFEIYPSNPEMASSGLQYMWLFFCFRGHLLVPK
jgi:hypothetical protein